MCEQGDCKDYIPDEEALEEVRKKMFGEKKKNEEKSNVKKIHVVLQESCNGVAREAVFEDDKYVVKFEGDWLKVFGGFSLDQLAFAVHKSYLRYVSIY